jgi:hypothetical protein
MVQPHSILIALLAVLQGWFVAEAFTVNNRSSPTTKSSLYELPSTINLLNQGYKKKNRFNVVSLKMSTNNDNIEETGSSPSRRRRKRKDGKNLVEPLANNTEEKEEVLEVIEQVENDVEKAKESDLFANVSQSPPAPKTVQLQIRDVRDVVSGVTPTSPQLVQDENDDEYYDDEDEDEDDDDEYEYYYEDENDNEVIVASGTKDSSLEALLADAKRMRQKEAELSDGSEEGFSIPSAIRGVISTIVTIDFFVVCALLAWFLAGIFFSYVVKDDTVQIAFNGTIFFLPFHYGNLRFLFFNVCHLTIYFYPTGIFEPVVQPALGILMIGSAAGGKYSE